MNMRALRSVILLGGGSLMAVSPVGLRLHATTGTENASALAAAPEIVDGHTKLGFERLAAFKFIAPNYDPNADPAVVLPLIDAQIPAEIKKYDGKMAILTGYMLPIRMDGTQVTELMLVSSPAACCYGAVPAVNEWVVIKMKPGAAVSAQLDVPVSFRGKLTVRGHLEGGYLTSIYALEGHSMSMP